MPDWWIDRFQETVTPASLLSSIHSRTHERLSSGWVTTICLGIELILRNNLGTHKLIWSFDDWKSDGEEFLERVLKRFEEKGLVTHSGDKYLLWRLTAEGELCLGNLAQEKPGEGNEDGKADKEG